MSDELTEGLRFHNTDHGIVEVPRKAPETHAYNLHEKAIARRRRLTGAAKALAALTFIGGAYMAASDSDYKQAEQAQVHASQELQEIKDNLYKPDSFFNGNVKIEMSDSLNVRKAPYINSSNTLEWSEIKELQGVSTQDLESFLIEKPLLTTRGANVDGQGESGAWIILNAIVDEGSGPTMERIFIALAKNTGEFVQVQDSGGTIKPLISATENDNLGNIVTQP